LHLLVLRPEAIDDLAALVCGIADLTQALAVRAVEEVGMGRSLVDAIGQVVAGPGQGATVACAEIAVGVVEAALGTWEGRAMS
jgi:hypothetical protein